MEFSEALPFLEENHITVVTTVTPSGRAQATVVGGGPVEGKMAFVSRDSTVKVKNARRTGRCAVTAIRPDNTRYVTVEGPAEVHGFDDTDASELLALLRKAYASSGRPPETWKD